MERRPVDDQRSIRGDGAAAWLSPLHRLRLGIVGAAARVGDGDDGTSGQATSSSNKQASPLSRKVPVAHRAALLNRRKRRLFATTDTDEKAMAAPASIGLRSPAAASGRAATL